MSYRNMFSQRRLVALISALGLLCGLPACGSIETTVPHPPSGSIGTQRIDHVIIIAIDGLKQDTLLAYLQNTPPTKKGGLHDLFGVRTDTTGVLMTKGVAVQQAVTVFPSFTYPSWTSMFTGLYPGAHGISGNNLFFRDRQTVRYYAEYHLDAVRAQLEEDFFSDDINPHVPTVHDHVRKAGGRSLIIHNMVTRGGEASKPDLDTLWNYKDNHTHAVDENSLWEAVRTLRAYNEKDASETLALPSVFTLYFSGLDHVEHIARDDPEAARIAYLAHLDNLLAQFFSGHSAITRNHFDNLTAEPVRVDPLAWPGLMRSAAWPHTAVIFVSDHGHSPVRWVDALGIEDLKLVFEELSERTGRQYRLEDPALVTENFWSKVRAAWGLVENGHVSDRVNLVATVNGGALGLHIRPKDGSWDDRPDYAREVRPVLEAMLLTMHKSHYEPESVLYLADHRYVFIPVTYLENEVRLLPWREIEQSPLQSALFPDAALRLNGLATRLTGDPDSAPDLILLADRARKLTYGNKRDWRVLEGLHIENHRHFHSDHGHLRGDESVVPLMVTFGGVQPPHPHATICQASIVDVAPTVLDLLGLLSHYEQALEARPSELKGRSLKGLLEQSRSQAHSSDGLCPPLLTP